MNATNTTTATAARNYLTLAEFVATRKEFDDIGLEFGFDSDGVRRGFGYADCCYIERDLDPATGKENGEYYLNVERSTWNDPDLAKLERILWAEHYVFDQGDVMLATDDGTLDDFICGICDAYNKPVDGDLFGVIFSSNRTWSPGEAFEKIVASYVDSAAVIAANVRVAAKANGAVVPMATLGRAHIETGVGVQSDVPAKGEGVQSGPSNFARTTADTLDAGACKQIITFLRSSAKQERVGLDLLEIRAMNRAVEALETILSWQTPS